MRLFKDFNLLMSSSCLRGLIDFEVWILGFEVNVCFLTFWFLVRVRDVG